jgi:hypothetical protein
MRGDAHPAGGTSRCGRSNKTEGERAQFRAGNNAPEEPLTHRDQHTSKIFGVTLAICTYYVYIYIMHAEVICHRRQQAYARG